MLFQTLHLGPPMSLWERCCLRSFADHGHQIVVFGYEKFDLPEGVRWAPAQEIVSDSDRERFFEHAPGAYARFSDLFRYEILNRRGGWWVDTDVLCRSSVVSQDDVVLGWESERLICGAILKIPAGHPLLAEAIEFSWENRNVDVWGHIGPQLLTRLIPEYDLSDLVRPQGVLYPVHYSAAFDLIDPNSRDTIAEIVGDAPFVHFWHAIFRRNGFQTNFLPPEGSYLGEAFVRHGGDGAPALDADAVRQQIRVIALLRDTGTRAAVLRAELDRLKGDKGGQ